MRQVGAVQVDTDRTGPRRQWDSDASALLSANVKLVELSIRIVADYQIFANVDDATVAVTCVIGQGCKVPRRGLLSIGVDADDAA